jgi:copper chaperone CopZ
MLGLPFALLRPLIAFFTGIVGGQLTNKITHGENGKAEIKPESIHSASVKKNPIVTILRYAFVDFIQDIAKWLVIGVVIAAIISVIIPDGFFTAYLDNQFLSMLIVLSASIPLYVCATGSVPIAAVLIMKGLSPGAALVFLMAGPATNAATITMIGKVMGRKTLIAYLSSIIGGALLFGFIINEFLPASWFMMGAHHHHAHDQMLPSWLGYSSSILLGLLIINAFRLKYFVKKKTAEETGLNINSSMETKVIKVKGMTCNHCKATVENGIRGLPGIKNVAVNLPQEQVTIYADNIDLAKIKTTVEGLGYTFGGEV